MNRDSLEAKYPGLITAMQEICDNAIYTCYCPGVHEICQMPNMLSSYLHRGRLGQVIDEVLHLEPE
jgi:hypothetical protein